MNDYALTLTRRYDGLFIATFPDLPEVTGYGRDGEEAVEEARRSLECAIKRRLAAGETLPPPSAKASKGIGTPALA